MNSETSAELILQESRGDHPQIQKKTSNGNDNAMDRELHAKEDNARIRSAADKKCVKIISVDVSKLVDGDGVPIDLTNTNNLRRWLVSRYKGREVIVRDSGQTIRFGNEELRACVKRRGNEQRGVYADLVALLENSIYYGYELGDARHPKIDRQDIYFAAAQIGNDVFGIRFKIDVRIGHENGRYKDHKVVKIKRSLPPYQGFSPSGIGSDQKPTSPYAGFTPTGTEGGQGSLPPCPEFSSGGIESGQSISVSKIREAVGTNSNINHSPRKVNKF